MRPTYAKIDTAKLRTNLRKIKAVLPEQCTVTAVVKANAYGHGSVVVGRIAAEEGYNALAVAFPEEATPLRDCGIMTPIYLLGLSLPETFDLIIENDCIPAVSSTTDFQALEECASRHSAMMSCCIAVDTGMHRIGIAPEEAMKMVARIESYAHLRVNGFFSHLANADAVDLTHARRQTERFCTMMKEIRSQRNVNYRFSLANSAALLVLPNAFFTDVRPGIIQYGIMPSPNVPNILGLQPVLSLHSTVVQTQRLATGESVGYGSSYAVTRPVTLATLPVGYADGYPRSLSNCGEVLIHGYRCPVVGRVCMDQTIVALPENVDATPGDEVVLIGTQDKETITAYELAALAGTIPYEILSGISARVPRIYV